mgnify:CR=1 FL=1
MSMGECVNDFVLTEEQRKLIEENHNLIYSYMIKHNLEFSEYYDLLAIALCKVAVYYNCERSEFSTLAFTFFDNACHNEYKRNSTLIRKPINGVVSLNYEYSSSDDGSSCCLQDLLEDDCNLEESICNKLYVQNAISFINKDLSEKERYIMYSLFIDKKTLQVIGDECGITKERVRQIKERVLERLRRKLIIR